MRPPAAWRRSAPIQPIAGPGGPNSRRAPGQEAQAELGQAGQNMRQVGNRNFFRRNNQWVDSQVTEKQAAHAQRIMQFSDEYFQLAEARGRELSQYLVFDEPVLFNVENQTYLIEPPPPAEIVVLEGTVSSLENRPRANPPNDWIVTLKIDRVAKGRFDGATFRFHVDSPEQSGLSVGGKYTVEARPRRTDTPSIRTNGNGRLIRNRR